MLGLEILNFSAISPAVISFFLRKSNICLLVESLKALKMFFTLFSYLGKYLNTFIKNKIFSYFCKKNIKKMQEYTLASRATDIERTEFYKKTYSHVALGVLVFIFIEYLFLSIPFITNLAMSLIQGRMWFIMLGGFMFVTYFAEKMAINSHERSKQYIGYGLYIAAEAFIFIPMIYIALQMTGGGDMIKQAAVLTLSLFGGLSAIVIITKKDFSFMKSALTVGSFIALGLIGAGLLFGFNLGLWFSVGMVVLAAGSILYQTSNLVHKYSTDQYVAAALGLFASLMLMFWYILRILMSRD